MKFLMPILISIPLVLISCSENNEVPIPNDDSLSPPAFPYVFMGNAYVNGAPIKEGTVIRAVFGDSFSGPADTLEGKYMNLIVVPNDNNDASQKITFEIINSAGATSKAKEDHKYEILNEPSIVNLVLNFSKYP